MTPPIIITPRNIFIAGFIIYMLSIKYRQLSQEGHTFNPPGAARTSRTLRKASSSGNGNNNKRSKEIGDDGALSCALSEPFEEFFMNAQHMLIHFRRWLPIHPSYLPNASSFSSQERIRLSKTVQKPRGIVLIVHGMGEHCARYDSFAKAMNQEGLIVYGIDHQGHGRSEGDRLYVDKFSDYVRDVIQLTEEIIIKEYPSLKNDIFICGHSLGGAVTACTLIKAQHLFKGAVFSGPAMMADLETAPEWKQSAAKILGAYFPRAELPTLGAEKVAKDMDVLDWFLHDPLVCQNGMDARLGGELMSTFEHIEQNAHVVKLPFLILFGGSDRICSVKGAEKFIALSESKNKSLIVLPGFLHELFCERDQTAVNHAISWINQTLLSS